MKALPQDEFALEMRNHFIDTALQTINTLVADGTLGARFEELCAEWVAEATGNEMPFLAELLGSLKKYSPEHGPKITSYLNELKKSGDDESFVSEFHNVTVLKIPVSQDEPKTYLQCRRGTMNFLLAVDNVVEISGHKKINRLPHKDSRVKGLIGFRGHSTPVFDLGLAGFPTSAEKSVFVICEHEKSFFALEVNSTDDIINVKPSEFQNSVTGPAAKFTTRDDKIFLLLDLPLLVAA